MNKLLAVDLPRWTGPGRVPADSNEAVTNLEKTISVVFGVLSLVAFIYFAIQIIFAGYAFISSNGDEKKLEEARHRLTNGILGLAIVIFAVGLSALLGKIFGIGNIFDLNALLGTMQLPR
jgi:hypothetical protein